MAKGYIEITDNEIIIESKRDININNLIKANTKLVDDNRILRSTEHELSVRIKRVLKAIKIGKKDDRYSESDILKGVERVLQGERSLIIEEILKEEYEEPDISIYYY